MKKCLITGCGGFIGSYLADLLVSRGMVVSGTFHHNRKNIEHLQHKIKVVQCNLLDKNAVNQALSDSDPDYIFHLGAQSHISPSWEDPENTLQVNILGTLYLLEAVRITGKTPIIEVVTSSAVYGNNLPNESAVKEDREFKPSSPYGISKIAQDMLAFLYWQKYQMKIVRARPFYTIGPGLATTAPADFSKRIVEIENGRLQSLSVGNLTAVRDVVDVRDCCSAMWMIAVKGQPGEAYNICSGKGHTVEQILDILISYANVKIPLTDNPERASLSGEFLLVGDNKKLRNLGWTPCFSLENTLSDILEHWRKTASC